MNAWLLLDTSAPRAMVARTEDGVVVRECSLDRARQHAEELPAAIDLVSPSRDLVGVCVGVGPGSFVGVRVGMSTAKGFARALGVPLVGVCSLSAMVDDESGAGFVALDARRGEVYVRAVLDGAPAGEVKALSPEDANELMRGASFVVTNCPALLDPALPLVERAGASARGLARLLAREIKNGIADQLAQLIPVYGRSPDARLPTEAR